MSRIRSCTFALAAFLLGLPLVASADTFNGILTVVWGDPRFAGSAGQVIYTLNTPDGRRVPLSVADGNAVLPFRGKSVVVTGQLSAPQAQARGAGLAPEPTVVVESMAIDPAVMAAATVHGGPSATVSGTKKVIFVLVKFSDDLSEARPDPHPASFFDSLTNPDTGSGSIPATINGFFKKTSNNLLAWDGDVAGMGGVGGTTWITLPNPKSFYAPCGWAGSCFGGNNTNFNNFNTHAVAAAQAQGVNFALYDNINFVISNDLDCCAWGGDLVVGGKSFGTTWEPPWGQETRVYAHEMGHSIGLPHSGWVYEAYDSPWDVMSGYSDAVQMVCGSYYSRNDASTQNIYCSEPGNGYIMAHRDVLGWIPAANQISVPAFGAVNVTLEGGSLPVGSALKMLKICLPGVPCTGTGSTTRYFTVEARVKDVTATTLFDHGIPNEGIIIHDVWFGRPAISGGCFFNNQSGWAVPVDATPGDYTGSPTCSYTPGQALFNAQFGAGQTYTNATYKFKVTVVSRAGNTFNIVVQSTVGPATGDFDGEAKAEATVYTSSGQWRILKSSTSYSAWDTVARGGVGFLPLLADFDGDGKLDPATYQPATGAWRAARSSTNYTTLFAIDWGGPAYQPVPGDYDGDGKADPALYKRSTGQWSVLKSSTAFATSINVTWGGPAQTAVPGLDFDGDGKDDIVTYQESTGAWRILKSSTDFTTSQVVGFGGPGYTLVAGDYDGDGKADPAVYNRSTGLWSALKSSTSFATSLSVGYGGAGFDPVPGDFDGDGRSDIGVVQRSTGNWYILKSSTSYTTTLPTIVGWGGAADTIISTAIVPGGYNKADMRVADFDGDGKSDMTLFQASTQTWYSLTSASNFMSSITRVWGAAGATPFSDDYDGDGKTDYAKYTQSTGAWEILLSRNGSTLTKTLGGSGYVPISVDFDGDGKADIGVFNQSTGNWLALKSSTNFTVTFSINWATGSAFAIAPGDFDGDGKTDLGSYRASTATWHILLSGMNYTTSLGGLPAMGGAGWVPVQADYDGDGRTDPVIYNPTTGNWYGLKSSSSYTTSISAGWGGAGFVPIRGDMDGDGKIDLALQQTSSANWYVLLSSTNYTTSIARGWGGAGFAPIPIF